MSKQIYYLFYLVSSLALVNSCTQNDPTAYFFITNTSESKKMVLIDIEMGEENVFRQPIKYSDISPDLQYTPSKQLPVGEYKIKVTADGGKIIQDTTIRMDSDKYIFVSYGYTAPADSITMEKLRKSFEDVLKVDPTFLERSFSGSGPNIRIHIMENEPMHR